MKPTRSQNSIEHNRRSATGRLGATDVVISRRDAARSIGTCATGAAAPLVPSWYGRADSTMARDDGWRFLVLGRSLERVDMTARLLLAGFCDPSGSPDWVTTLRSCSAHEAFLRTYKRGVDSSLVAEFLLLDRLFPRSAFHALGVAERCLAELVPSAGRAGQEDEARRILGRARNELEFAGVRELLADVPSYLTSLQSVCADAGAAVARRFFQQTASVEWRRERVSRV